MMGAWESFSEVPSGLRWIPQIHVLPVATDTTLASSIWGPVVIMTPAKTVFLDSADCLSTKAMNLLITNLEKKILLTVLSE
jgi:hypothetical protein